MRTSFFMLTVPGTGGVALYASANLTQFQEMTEVLKKGLDGELEPKLDDEGKPILRALGLPHLLYAPKATKDPACMVDLLIWRIRPVGPEGKFIPVKVGSKEWTPWLLTPLADGDAGKKVMRKFIRERLGTQVLGPFTKPALKRHHPQLHDLLCPNDCVPHVIMGDDPVQLGKLDYEPSQADADNDVAPPEPEGKLPGAVGELGRL